MFSANARWSERRAPKPVPLAPLLQRLQIVRALLADPAARARRLAYHLSRKQAGPLLAPGVHEAVRNRYRTEFSTLYTSNGHAIGQASRARPPPIGLVLRPHPELGRSNATLANAGGCGKKERGPQPGSCAGFSLTGARLCCVRASA